MDATSGWLRGVRVCRVPTGFASPRACPVGGEKLACPGAWSRAPGEPGGSAVRTCGLFRALPGLGRKKGEGLALAGVC